MMISIQIHVTKMHDKFTIIFIVNSQEIPQYRDKYQHSAHFSICK